MFVPYIAMVISQRVTDITSSILYVSDIASQINFSYFVFFAISSTPPIQMCLFIHKWFTELLVV